MTLVVRIEVSLERKRRVTEDRNGSWECSSNRLWMLFLDLGGCLYGCVHFMIIHLGVVHFF